MGSTCVQKLLDTRGRNPATVTYSLCNRWLQEAHSGFIKVLCPRAGSFTQLVWRDSKELGVGVACDGAKAFVVGHYRPAGNVVNEGSFQSNVLPKGNR